MAKFILDGQEYGGGSGSNVVKLTQAEYDALPNDKLSDDNIYLITDSGALTAENLFYDDAETGLGVNNVQDAIVEQNKNLNVRYNYETDAIQCLFNGEWQDFMAVSFRDSILYSYGNEYESVSGGWSNVRNLSVNFTKNSDNMYSNSHASASGGIATTNTIDLTPFKSLKVKADITGIYSIYGLTIYILNSNKETVANFEMNEKGLKDWVFDISSLTGEHHIELYKPAAKECTGYIYDVRLGISSNLK